MTFKEYMSEVLKYDRVTLGNAERKFLHEIMGKPKSAYTIFSILREKGQPMAYKNVHTRIKRLEELKLIEKVPGKFSRRAINYQLTTQGLFYILSQIVGYRFYSDWPIFLKDYYSDNIIFKTLLFPYFEIETLTNADYNLYHSVLSYLRNCYQITLNACDHINHVRSHMDQEYVKRFTERLKKELEWEARELAFSLITKMPDSSTPIFILALGKGYPERNAKAGGKPGQLGKDKRFVKLLREVQKDFDQGFRAVNTTSKQQNRR